MNAIKTERTNRTLLPPEQMEDRWLPLPVERWFAEGDGTPMTESTFELSDEDIEAINRDRRIYLNICGPDHPALMLTVFSVAEEMADAQQDVNFRFLTMAILGRA